jgi:hypothetical protein
VFSSRKLERATYDSVAFRFIAANEHPDDDTIANHLGPSPYANDVLYSDFSHMALSHLRSTAD